jgi:hypothetical protein
MTFSILVDIFYPSAEAVFSREGGFSTATGHYAQHPLLRTHDLAAEGDLKMSKMTKVPRFRHYCTAFSF